MTSAVIQINESVNLGKYLNKIDVAVRDVAKQMALEAAGRIVAQKAASLAPIGKQTGTSAKKSKRQRERDAKRKPLHKAVDLVTRKYKRGKKQVVVVGAVKPHAPHGHLVEGGHEGVFWGKRFTRQSHVAAKRWLAPAVDSTQSQQHDAIVSTLKQYMDQPN